MLRAGLIRRVAAGIYNWMPLGLRVLRRVEHIVGEEMERAGALELSMPVVQPGELWEGLAGKGSTGPSCVDWKIDISAPSVLDPPTKKSSPRSPKARSKATNSCRSMFQIQTNSDEIRPRFGVMRSRVHHERRLLLSY